MEAPDLEDVLRRKLVLDEPEGVRAGVVPLPVAEDEAVAFDGVRRLMLTVCWYDDCDGEVEDTIGNTEDETVRVWWWWYTCRCPAAGNCESEVILVMG